MENAQKRIAADVESEFPEEIIQHIQSLLSERDAARSTFLSKSWHRAWSTRPHLCFDQFAFRHSMDDFPRFTRNFMQRYEDLNPKMKSFKLWMVVHDDSLATELILKAIKLGAIDLTVEFSVWDTSRCFVIPDEVLESQTLARLSVSRAMVDFKNTNKSPNLKSLSLSNVTVNSDLIRDLISRCPSLEELTLTKLTSSHPFCVDEMIKLHKLKYLRLEGLDIRDSLSKSSNFNLWHQFPCLKELAIVDCNSKYEWDDVRICSPSLERIAIVLPQPSSVNAEFDVPNLRYFKFEGRDVPRLEFNTTGGRGWESDIHVHCSPDRATASSLNQLVKMLSPSRVHLTVFVCELPHGGCGYMGDGLAIPVVESLTIRGVAAPRAFLDALLWSCCPNFINIQRCYAEMVDVEVFRQLKMKMKTKTRNPRELLRFQRK
ncbi:putative F-box/LRR-repeat protein At5g02930 [Salvia miltiorrhiza]|uniref:putative F-box/LRR-repeat protein At5g02930 n=1 Tax=Salvia miltiorrhiza TaxID=226208 RepID=UPI0025ABEC3A|nr:putative F-box/LRR-repeat protein At5g02930 [Salvia miltiorrhiza]